MNLCALFPRAPRRDVSLSVCHNTLSKSNLSRHLTSKAQPQASFTKFSVFCAWVHHQTAADTLCARSTSCPLTLYSRESDQCIHSPHSSHPIATERARGESWLKFCIEHVLSTHPHVTDRLPSHADGVIQSTTCHNRPRCSLSTWDGSKPRARSSCTHGRS